MNTVKVVTFAWLLGVLVAAWTLHPSSESVVGISSISPFDLTLAAQPLEGSPSVEAF